MYFLMFILYSPLGKISSCTRRLDFCLVIYTSQDQQKQKSTGYCRKLKTVTSSEGNDEIPIVLVLTLR